MKLKDWKKNEREGRIALVTGSSRGIGRATALKFAQEGYDLVVNYVIHSKEAYDTAKQIEGINRRVLVVQADVGSEKGISRLADEAIKQFGRVDVLVNNAGIGQNNDTIESQNFGEWERLFWVHSFGPVFLTKLLVPQMKKNGFGKIVNIISDSGFGIDTTSGSYGPSKASLLVWTLAAAKELAPFGINMNAVSPGLVLTDMTFPDPESRKVENLKKIARSFPSRSVTDPKDVADLIFFLCSDQARQVAGQVIHINGANASFV